MSLIFLFRAFSFPCIFPAITPFVALFQDVPWAAVADKVQDAQTRMKEVVQTEVTETKAEEELGHVKTTLEVSEG